MWMAANGFHSAYCGIICLRLPDFKCSDSLSLCFQGEGGEGSSARVGWTGHLARWTVDTGHPACWSHAGFIACEDTVIGDKMSENGEWWEYATNSPSVLVPSSLFMVRTASQLMLATSVAAPTSPTLKSSNKAHKTIEPSPLELLSFVLFSHIFVFMMCPFLCEAGITCIISQVTLASQTLVKHHFSQIANFLINLVFNVTSTLTFDLNLNWEDFVATGHRRPKRLIAFHKLAEF